MSSPPFSSERRDEPLSVLVVDDVDEIRHLLTQWLREAGASARDAATGNEALRELRGAPVDLLVTDILMPDRDGLELIAEVRRSRPTVRILAISGGGRHLRADDCLKFAKGLGAHGLLMKPFSRQQFLEALSQVVPRWSSPAST
jgi:CheY-like chemotaxis protein